MAALRAARVRNAEQSLFAQAFAPETLRVLDRRDDFVQFRKLLRAEDVDRRNVECDSPECRQMLLEPDGLGRNFFGTVHGEFLHVPCA